MLYFERKKKNEKFDIIKKKRFHEANIDFFDSHYFEIFDKDDVIVIDDKTYYRNVWLFLDFAKTTTLNKDNILIRRHLHRCFRNDAQFWYIVELDFMFRDTLKIDSDLKNWEQLLSERFKMSKFEVLKLLTEDRYFIEDVRQKRSIISYV